MLENQNTQILWDFNIRTGRVIEAGCPDIVFIDVVIPRDICVRDKKTEKNIKIIKSCIGDILNVESKN